ncbi:trypsin-like peptidase domain-containing protein [Candidatus Woesearchaeota archaeon]|nr:trypsin-like peptidase domain-containing protein [Candidatus Woesearchaeota archaeon]
MAEKELEDYIKTQRSLGVNEHAIRKSLLDAGYTEGEFKDLLARHAKKSSGGTGFTPTVKHILCLNLVIVIAFMSIVSYLAYDYNVKLNNLSAEHAKQLSDAELKMASQGETLSSQISSVESSLRGEMEISKTRIEQVNTDLVRKLQDYNYQAMQRDTALSDSIQKTSNRSLSEISSFSQQLETVKRSTVDFSQIIPKVLSAVVTIGRKGPGYFNTAGSGVFVNKEGYIVTNYHVVDDLGTVTVRTHDEKEYTATIIGKNENWDVAVVKPVTEKNNFEYLEWADIDAVSVGDAVIAVGNPVGFESTVTQGIISNTKRLIPGEIDIYYLQTDVAINAGNSGGPLVNKEGKIVGIATLKYSRVGYEGLSFALRSNDVQGILMNILQKGK